MRSRTPTQTQTKPSRQPHGRPPSPARQKNLLAKRVELVEEHRQLAREFGVDPDEPEQEEIGKAKATSLIGAMLNRINAQAPPDER